MHCIFRFPPFAVIVAAALLAAALSAPASAQQPYVEKLYSPPVGSRWVIQSDSKSVEHRAAGDERNQQTSMRSELTITRSSPTATASPTSAATSRSVAILRERGSWATCLPR